MTDFTDWARPSPFVRNWQIQHAHIDHYNHVNNVAYLAEMESLAWAHSNSLGLTFADYQACGKGMVIRRHELDYLLAAHEDDTLLCATWITECKNGITLTRQFQFVCAQRHKVVFAAKTQFVCVKLNTGSPTRMPNHFKQRYGAAVVAS
ncbi:thioesterase family protein [Alteromonas sp. C1M14]|uniref:acyl-CoA thioesterase n=1 Tax=Alteromonas sp. C1M14 TaxID=2841567 RepID=UPI001C09C1D5|nr:thioesterase family protein [Alteromonas sp. C1M14]MBU2979755.1 acyl-CoA thioesterase [Alteromonas sp. C1M14]